MGLNKRVAVYMTVLATCLVACGSFPYRWYTPDMSKDCYQAGKLLGPEPKDDKPMTVCEPDSVDKAKCVIMLLAEFEKLKSERDELLERLKDCEGG